MKVLVVGSGGREHALVWKIAQSKKVEKIYCAPGNGGIGEIAECVNISAEDINGLLAFAEEEKIDLTVVGPEAPLMAGITETFQEAGLRIFAPSSKAALIEGSKELAKQIMVKYQIPTAEYKAFIHAKEAVSYVKEKNIPFVVKADGLAAGKGVIVAASVEETCSAIEDMLEGNRFGEAGAKVILEEILKGPEVSVLAFTDGENVVPMVWSQDHKRAYDGDKGPNTGGMGAYTPPRYYTEELEKEILDKVLKPTINGLKKEGRTYKGVIYAGLMLTEDGPKVLEYNARFGDPETQVVLMRLESDLVEIMEAIIDGKLSDSLVSWKDEAAAAVILASGGYPESYEKNKEIIGLDEALKDDQVVIFHAGTYKKDNKFYTSGGRVLAVCAYGENLREAVDKAYAAVGKIGFEKMEYRRDIGWMSL